jgi:exopolyphosphatase/guanosine-5'-triphosphate,3'-diphosphate pyrophosphatase
LTHPRLASIDIGTNSAILLVAERGEDGPLRPVLQRVAAPRVGRNLAATGRISEGSFDALTAALDGFLGEIRSADARLVGAVATEAFRKAANGPELLAKVSAQLGIACRILTGEEEARYGWAAVHDRQPLPGLAVIDIGAGSTEVTRREGAVSLPIGAVALLEACGLGRKDLAEACRGKALASFREAFQGRTGLVLPENLVAVGGTASALAMLKLDLKAFDSAAIEGLELTRDEVTAAIRRLEALPSAERAALPGLDPGRAEIIVPGLCILESFLDFAGRDRFRVSDRGIRYGILLDSEGKAGHGR